jgi:hypothetical protein
MTISMSERGLEIVKAHEKNIHSELPFKSERRTSGPPRSKRTSTKNVETTQKFPFVSYFYLGRM